MVESAGLYDMYKRTIWRLNHVCLSMDIYAMSYLARVNVLSIWQDMVATFTPGAEEQSQSEWPQDQPTASDPRLWAEKLQEITSTHYCLRRQLVRCIREPYKSL